MKRFSVVFLGLAMLACDSAPRATQAASAQVQTIHSIPAQPAQLNPPPMLVDEAPPPKPKPLHQWDVPEPIIFSPEDEKLRAALPFTPAIAMDPIDGSKISIRAATPTFEYKGKIYYFSNEANKQQFAGNPDAVVKAGFTKL